MTPAKREGRPDRAEPRSDAPPSYAERKVMEHATAWFHKNRLYRNHFTTGPETSDWPIIRGLCARGLMVCTRSPDPQLGGMSVFKVTDAGIAALKAVQP